MPVKYKAPGKGFLQVPGILMIVFSSILILILLLGATVLGSVGAMAGLADVDMAEAMEELMDGAQVMLDNPTVHRELLALGLGMIMIVLNLISGIVITSPCCYLQDSMKADKKQGFSTDFGKVNSFLFTAEIP